MTAAVTIEAPEGRALAIGKSTTSDIIVPEGRALGVVNVPSPEMNFPEARTLAVVHDPAIVRLAEGRVLAVVRGHIANPRIRAWTFTLDGHDYYVLNLGETETLVYDTHSEMWYSWGSDSTTLWRAVTGCNWQDGTKVASVYGSSVVVGDYIQGVLYALNPDSDLDDDVLVGSAVPHSFQRVVQGQIVTKGYDAQRCYAVDLTGSIGELESSLLTGIQLEYSDDQGHSYVDAGTIDVPATDYSARVSWKSLGSIYEPGRLFRITDYGALRRIDSLDMLDDQGGK